MKRIQIISLLAASLMLFGGTSCKQFDQVREIVTYKADAQTADQVVVNAQKTAAIAGETFNEFVKLERQYSTETKKYLPKVHEFADYLRAPTFDKDGKPVLTAKGNPVTRGVALVKSLRAATATFQVNRTESSEANLRTILASVTDLFNRTKANLADMQKQGLNGQP